MKKSALFLVLMGLAVWGATLRPAFAKPRTVKSNAPALPQWERQLLSHIKYPEVLQQGNHEGVVVVRFRVDEESRLAKLEVFTNNQELNQDLTRQLTGKKVLVTDGYVPETHTVRLRFRLTD